MWIKAYLAVRAPIKTTDFLQMFAGRYQFHVSDTISDLKASGFITYSEPIDDESIINLV